MGRCCKHQSHQHAPIYTGKATRASPRPVRPCCTKRRPKSASPAPTSCAKNQEVALGPLPTTSTLELLDPNSEPADVGQSTSDVTDLLGDGMATNKDIRQPLAFGRRTPRKKKVRNGTWSSKQATRTTTSGNEVEYYLYVFLHQRNIDKEILPFTRRKCIENAYIEAGDNEKLKAALAKLGRDDRRLAKVEINSQCKVDLGQLVEGAADTFVRGLPRRRLTIRGPTYCNIALAINMLEESFPRLMRDVLYPYPLPTGTTTKYETDDAMARTVFHHIDHETSNIGLRSVFNDRAVQGCAHVAAFVETAKQCLE